MTSDTEELLQLPVDPVQALQRGEQDFNFFAGLVLQDVMKFPFPPYYIALWMLVVKAIKEGRDDKLYKIIRYAIGLPRGFAKTTFLKVLVCWLICYEKITFALIVCATEPLAYSFLSDVSSMMQSDAISTIYGIWEPAVDNAGAKKGVFRGRIIILKAIGANSSVRGINEENRRPDFLLCDDMQTKENDDSDTERVDLFNWFVGTLLKVVQKSFSAAFYIGNMYSDHCILHHLKESSEWISLITGAINADEESIWPELQSLDDLFNEFIHDESLDKGHIWFAEVMNDPIESSNSLLKGPFPRPALSVIPPPDASFITVDPAGFRNNADDNVITAHHIMDNCGYIPEMQGGIWDPLKTCEETVNMALRWDASLIAIEANGYQQTLGFWMAHYMKEEGIEGIYVVPIVRQKNTKEQHIRLFIKEAYASNYYFLREEDRIKFVYQATAYRVGKQKNKDDYLDSPAMGIQVRNEYAHMLSIRNATFSRKITVRGRNTPF